MTLKKYENALECISQYACVCVCVHMVSLFSNMRMQCYFWNAVVSSKWLSRELGLKLRIIKKTFTLKYVITTKAVLALAK